MTTIFYYVDDYGTVGSGDDTSVIQAAENAVSALGGGKLCFSARTYLVNSTGIKKASNVEWIGANRNVSVLKALAQNFNGNGIVNGSGVSGFKITDLGFDVSQMTNGNSVGINTQNCSDYDIESCIFVGNFWLAICHDGGNEPRIDKCRFLRYSGSTQQNQAVVVSTAAGSVQNGYVTRNYCQNTGMDLSAQYLHAAMNNIFNWQFGGGITTEQSASCADLHILGNFCIGGGAVADVNQTIPLGIENWAPRSVVSFNSCLANGGDGIANGGQNSNLVGNVCANNGQNNGNGITTRWSSASINGDYSNVVGNQCVDIQAAPTQSYGYADYNSSLVGVFLSGNTLTGNKLAGPNIQGNTAFSTPIFHASYVVPAQIIGNAQSAGYVINFPEATFGDMCIAGYGEDLHGMKLFAEVSPQGGQVLARIENNVGQSVNLQSAKIWVAVVKCYAYRQY